MDNIIEIKNLSKMYKLYEKPVDRLKESISLSKKVYHREHHALSNITLSIQKGDSIGLVGKNGAGKSTLLKIITGVLTPTTGELHVHGRISAHLELGAGFNMEYTGIENIYLNGTMMGYSNDEIKAKIPSILEFADIGDFVYQPVKVYSSGMFARLAFAVAVNVEPDILIVDETLSVGDSKFQTKCIEKMKEIKEKGTTILFVSHATEQIRRFCNKAVWLSDGQIIDQGEAGVVVDRYEMHMEKSDDAQIEQGGQAHFGLMAKIKGVTMNQTVYQTFDTLEVVVDYEVFEEKIEGMLVGVAIYTQNREYIFGPNTYLEKVEIPETKGIHTIKYVIPKLLLLSGAYTIDVGLFNNESIVILDYNETIIAFNVENKYISEGKFYLPHEWQVVK